MAVSETPATGSCYWIRSRCVSSIRRSRTSARSCKPSSDDPMNHLRSTISMSRRNAGQIESARRSHAETPLGIRPCPLGDILAETDDQSPLDDLDVETPSTQL